MGGFSVLHGAFLLLVVAPIILIFMTLWQLHRYLRAQATLKEGEVLAMRRRMLDSLKSTSSENQG